MATRIAAARATLGDRLVILGHHYQRDEVIRFADYTGDSFKLAREIAKHPEAEYIVFCGVHFMAESADILALPHQKVILPDLAAGCSMADMAAPDQLEICWSELQQTGRGLERGPRSPTSTPRRRLSRSSASAAAPSAPRRTPRPRSKWGWSQREKILFLPDQHLGRNTAWKMGVPLDEMVVWDPFEPFGGLTREAGGEGAPDPVEGPLLGARALHRAADRGRAQPHPGVRVIVHPEVPFEVLQAADDFGSTEYILKTVREAPAGTTWAVGTEVHLVHRLAEEVAPEKTVLSLDTMGCLCSTMFRVSPNHLLWVLDGLVDGKVHNHIVVPEHDKKFARIALDRMLTIT